LLLSRFCAPFGPRRAWCSRRLARGIVPGRACAPGRRDRRSSVAVLRAAARESAVKAPRALNLLRPLARYRRHITMVATRRKLAAKKVAKKSPVKKAAPKKKPVAKKSPKAAKKSPKKAAKPAAKATKSPAKAKAKKSPAAKAKKSPAKKKSPAPKKRASRGKK